MLIHCDGTSLPDVPTTTAKTIMEIDAACGSYAPDALGGFALGDSPSVAMVIIDGELVVAGSKMTVPTQRFYRFVRKG